MKKLFKNFLCVLLICCFAITAPVNAMGVQGDDVNVITDTDELRKVVAVIDGEKSTVTYYKKSNTFKIEANGNVLTIDNPKSPFTNNIYTTSAHSTRAFSRSSWETMNSLSLHKLYYSERVYEDGRVIYRMKNSHWSWFWLEVDTDDTTAIDLRLVDSYHDKLQSARDHWDTMVGALIGVGAGAVVAAVLFMLPEPVASKATAVAALTAAGASAGVALGAGGFLYLSSERYSEAMEIYEKLDERN